MNKRITLCRAVIFCAVCGVSFAAEYSFDTLAGLGMEGFEDAQGRDAKFNNPQGIAVDKAGTVYVADTGNSVIRKITPDGTVTNYVGVPGETGCIDGKVAVAKFDHPKGLTFDAAGNLYVADAENNVIRKITTNGVVSTLAGTRGRAGYVDGEGTTAQFNWPFGLAVDSATNVYVADHGNHVIRKITPDSKVSTLAGCPGNPGNRGGKAAEAQFKDPAGVAVDQAGNVYVADSGNDLIRMISTNGIVSVLAGGSEFRGEIVDGKGAAAHFSRPKGIAIDQTGILYVADTLEYAIRRIASDGTVKTLGGRFVSKYERPLARVGRDGIGADARFNCPSAIAVDAAGTLYICDTEDNIIRIARPVK